ncbi:hypothetical protein ABES38_11870 [Bacillus gobiensis]|uniref:hypothetical protein n=1 Tax=Bacillus gobiensis TaxID=1441095 RepID=UPI003D23132D
MYLKEIQLYDESNETSLNSECICMTEMFLWELGKKFKTDNCEAIFFHCGNYEQVCLLREEQESYDVLIPKKSYDVQLPFNKREYTHSSPCEKKRMMSEALREGMSYLSKLKGWDQDRVKDAIEMMYEKQFHHSFKPWRGKLSPNRKAKAYPVVELDLDKFSLELVVENTKKEILQSKMIAVTKPDLHDLSYYMQKIEWLNNHEVALYTRAHRGTYNSIKINSLHNSTS